MAERRRFRKKQIHVYLHDHEHESIVEHCKEHNITVANFFRNIMYKGIENTPTPNFNSDDAKTLLKELNAIGNNVNQIAYRYHSKQLGDNEVMIELQDSFTLLLTIYDSWIMGKED